MARTPKLPEGVSLYKDRTGSREIYRVRLGLRFLGPGTKPVKRAFTAHADAVNWIRSENERLFGKPMEIEGVSADQVADMRVAVARLRGKASLVEAANAWIKYVEPFQKCPTVREVADKVVAAKVKAGITDEYAEELKEKFDLYLAGYLNKQMSDFSSDDVDAILDRNDKRKNAPSQSQRAKRLRFLRILVRHALRKGWIQRNPLSADPPKIERHPVVILSPIQVAKLLIAAQTSVPHFLGALAIKLFGGPRNTEIMKLTWGAICEGEITLPAAYTKTERLRGVAVHPTLEAWLELCPKVENEKILPIPEGLDPEQYWQKQLKATRVAADIKPWPQNALRHAFCSYHYALHQDEDLTAAIAGNSPAVIKANYINAVKKRDCERFWTLIPAVAEVLAAAEPDQLKYRKSELADFSEPDPEPEEN